MQLVSLCLCKKYLNSTYFSGVEFRWNFGNLRMCPDTQDVRSVHIQSCFGLYFPAFGVNVKIYSVNLRILPEYRKIKTRRNSEFAHLSCSAKTCSLNLLMTSVPHHIETTQSVSIWWIILIVNAIHALQPNCFSSQPLSRFDNEYLILHVWLLIYTWWKVSQGVVLCGSLLPYWN